MIDAAVTSAVTNLQTAIDNAGTLQGASQSALAPVLSAVSTALAAIDAQAASIEASIDETSLGGIHVGQPAPQMVLTLVAQTQLAVDLSSLKTLRGYVARIAVNIQNAPG